MNFDGVLPHCRFLLCSFVFRFVVVQVLDTSCISIEACFAIVVCLFTIFETFFTGDFVDNAGYSTFPTIFCCVGTNETVFFFAGHIVFCLVIFSEVSTKLGPCFFYDFDLQIGNVGFFFPNKKLPLLNSQVWIENTPDNGPQIRFEHYEKPMASDLEIQKESAMPDQIKRATLVQGGLTRLLNTSIKLGEEKQQEILSLYMKKLQTSGYDENYRLEI